MFKQLLVRTGVTFCLLSLMTKVHWIKSLIQPSSSNVGSNGGLTLVCIIIELVRYLAWFVTHQSHCKPSVRAILTGVAAVTNGLVLGSLSVLYDSDCLFWALILSEITLAIGLLTTYVKFSVRITKQMGITMIFIVNMIGAATLESANSRLNLSQVCIAYALAVNYTIWVVVESYWLYRSERN